MNLGSEAGDKVWGRGTLVRRLDRAYVEANWWCLVGLETGGGLAVSNAADIGAQCTQEEE
jgi:hypothetical protein